MVKKKTGVDSIVVVAMDLNFMAFLNIDINNLVKLLANWLTE